MTHKIRGKVFRNIYVTRCSCGKEFITGNTYFNQQLYESLTVHFLAAQEHLEEVRELQMT